MLADCLATPAWRGEETWVEQALESYQQRRLARVNGIVRKARQRAEMIHGHNPAVAQQWYQQLATESPHAVIEAIAKTILAGALA